MQGMCQDLGPEHEAARPHSTSGADKHHTTATGTPARGHQRSAGAGSALPAPLSPPQPPCPLFPATAMSQMSWTRQDYSTVVCHQGNRKQQTKILSAAYGSYLRPSVWMQ